MWIKHGAPAADLGDPEEKKKLESDVDEWRLLNTVSENFARMTAREPSRRTSRIRSEA